MDIQTPTPKRELVEHFTLNTSNPDPIATDEFAQVVQQMLFMLHIGKTSGVNASMHLSKFICSKGNKRYIIDFKSL